MGQLPGYRDNDKNRHLPASNTARRPSVLRNENRYARFRQVFKWAFGTTWHALLPAGMRPWTIKLEKKNDRSNKTRLKEK